MPFVDVFAPGLIAALDAFPDAAAAVPLTRMLVRARREPAVECAPDAVVPVLLGMQCEPDTPPALAALTGAVDLERDTLPDDLVRADPVHLRADPTRLVMFDAESIGLESDEADALIAHLNTAFEGGGFTLERGRSPLRWYARLPGVERLRVPSPHALRGLTAESCLDALREAGPANRLVTEAQMVLAGAPVNVARERAGRPPVNSLWLWGLGSPPRPGPGRLAGLAGDDEFVAACARACGVAHRPLDGGLAALASDTAGALGIVAPVAREADALARFEREVGAPARTLLATRRVREVRFACDGQAYVCGRFDRWAIWRRRAVSADGRPA